MTAGGGMSWTVRLAAVFLLVAMLGAATAVAGPRIHRVILPPPPPLPTSLAFDEDEWSITPSKRVVAAGEVTMRVYNRGMDDHDLTVVDAEGRVHQVYLGPGENGTIVADLPAGEYRIVCSLEAGTPQSHEDLGMWTTLTVRDDPARAPVS